MSTNISRRKVVAGAAWAAPVVAASAAVPAFASSTECEWESTAAYTAEGNASGAKGSASFIVPELVDKIKFEVVGGAGGTNYDDIAAGSGAKVTGIIEVKPGQTVQLIGAAGGIGNNPLTPAEGGAGFVNAGGANNNFDYIFPGAVDAGRLWPDKAKRNVYPVIGSTGGSAEGAAGSAGNQGALTYSADTSVTTTVNAGEGGSAGIGGNGGSKTDLPSGKSPNGVLGYSSTNNQEIYHSSKSGNNGGDGFKGNGGDGVGSYSYMIDNNDRTIKEVVTVKATGEKKALEYSSIGFNWNGYQSVISAGGGAGYGGGGSGASTSASAIVVTQKWNNNPDGLRQNTGFSQFGGGGGAGGSYVAPGVAGGSIESAGNAPTARGARGNGYVKVTLCKRTA